MIAVFCYGTLEFPQIMAVVTGRRFPAARATLHGYARYLIKDAIYPAIVVETGANTPGTLYRGIDPASLRWLDRYEDPLYVRRAVTVCTDAGDEIAAQTYLVPPQRRWALSSKRWNREHFERYHLRRYLANLGR